MKNSVLGMLCSYLIEEKNIENSTFHDHRKVLLSLIDCLSSKYKKDAILPVLCNVYNDDANDNTSISIKKYLETKDIHYSVNKDFSSCDAELLIRTIPLAFYLAFHEYITQEQRYEMIEDIIKLTHTHPIAIISATIYCSMLLAVIENKNMDNEIEKIFYYIHSKIEYRDWLRDFNIFVHMDRVRKLHTEDILDSTFIIDALTSSLWTMLCSFDYKTSLDKLRSVTSNETILLLATTLVGAKYGLDSIDKESLELVQDELNTFNKIIKRYEL